MCSSCWWWPAPGGRSRHFSPSGAQPSLGRRGSGRAEIRGQHPRIDSGASEGRAPAVLDVAIVKQLVIAGRGEPPVAAQLLLELAAPPPGIAQGGEPLVRPAPLGNGSQDIEGGGERP